MRTRPPRWVRWLVLAYVAALIGAPVGLVLYNAFASGLAIFWAALMRPEALHAIGLTLLVTAIAVPFNTVFGVVCAFVLVRSRNPLRGILGPLVSLPLALSPVVVGLALLLAYGARGWLGPTFSGLGLRVMFDVPGIVLATMFVGLPFVVRAVEPVLREFGVDQEEAAAISGASALQTFWYVTLPNIRHAVGYSVVLTIARSVGEFGAVSVVSGHLVGRTQTLTQYVGDRYMAFDLAGAYMAATMLGVLAVLSLAGLTALRNTVSETESAPRQQRLPQGPATTGKPVAMQLEPETESRLPSSTARAA
ncbi:MAG TPA: sulfate ABC transporter permease subunit [Chloroflexota bacterium]|nr:sulfate ABC transporter permease subunit [Chloroflexota bacterium]